MVTFFKDTNQILNISKDGIEKVPKVSGIIREAIIVVKEIVRGMVVIFIFVFVIALLFIIIIIVFVIFGIRGDLRSSIRSNGNFR